MNNVYYTTTGSDPHQHLSTMSMQQSQSYPQQAYPSIDFYYETPHFQQQEHPTTKVITSNPAVQYPPISDSSDILLLSSKPMDEDYVENLNNELVHTKQLLKQYQLRTEQLMGLVKKQTDKINELRSQLAE